MNEKNRKTSNKRNNIVRLNKMSDVLTVKEMREILACSDYTVRKLIRENKIHGVFCGHGYRVSKKSLLTYLEGSNN